MSFITKKSAGAQRSAGLPLLGGLLVARKGNKMAKDTNGYDTLTVTELINELKKMPPDAFVYHEGCDCIGNAHTVELDKNDGTVLITRSN